MPDDAQIATHQEPALRHRSNYIIRIALDSHGLPGRFEQVWARQVDADFELCCIPYFAYGLSLGDRLIWSHHSESAEVVAKSGHKTIRIAFLDGDRARTEHQNLHGELARTGCLMEWLSDGYGAVDLADDTQERAVLEILGRWFEAGGMSWEWADPAQD